MTHLTHFEHNVNFLSKFNRVTFAQFLKPVTRYSFKKTYLIDFEKNSKKLILIPKMTYIPILGIRRIFFKMQNSHFKLLCNTFHQVQFQKNLRNRFREKFKNVDFRPRMTLFPYFGFNKNFP